MFRHPLICACVLLIAASTFFTSCIFKSEDEYFNKVAKPDPNAVSGSIHVVDLADYNSGDTINVFGTTYVNLSLSGPHGNIESGTASLGKEDSWNNIDDVSNGSFILSLYDLKSTGNGIFMLRLDLVTSSGSGSLADKLGAEKVNITLKWIVKIDLSPPAKPVPTLGIVDGFLTLQWPAYTRPNFQSYVVNRKLPNGLTQTFEIKDSKINRWKDENYAGGYGATLEYSLSIVTEPGTTTSDGIPYADPMIITSSTFNLADSTVTIKWKPTKFYGAFKGYKFDRDGGIDVTTLTNVNDSTFTYKMSFIYFGAKSTLGFTVQAKSAGLTEYWNWNYYTLGTPLPFTPVGKIVFNPYLNSLVTVDANKQLITLNDQFEPVGPVAALDGANWRMPYPGNYIYSTSTNSTDDHIYRLNLQDNSKVSYDYAYLNDKNSNTVASNGLICIDYDRSPYPPAHITALSVTNVFDPADPTHYAYAASSTTTKLTAVISDDGKFVWANNNSVFRISGGTSTLVASFTGSGTFAGFRQDNSDEIMFLNGNKMDFYDTNTLTFLRSITVPAPYYSFTYDVQSKTMLWVYMGSGSLLYLINIETGATKTVEVAYATSSSDFSFVNGLLLYQGTYIKIN